MNTSDTDLDDVHVVWLFPGKGLPFSLCSPFNIRRIFRLFIEYTLCNVYVSLR